MARIWCPPTSSFPIHRASRSWFRGKGRGVTLPRFSGSALRRGYVANPGATYLPHPNPPRQAGRGSDRPCPSTNKAPPRRLPLKSVRPFCPQGTSRQSHSRHHPPAPRWSKIGGKLKNPPPRLRIGFGSLSGTRRRCANSIPIRRSRLAAAAQRFLLDFDARFDNFVFQAGALGARAL